MLNMADESTNVCNQSELSLLVRYIVPSLSCEVKKGFLCRVELKCTTAESIFTAINRMEPLLLRDYSRIAPVQIQSYNAAVRVDYKDMPFEWIVPDVATASTSSTPSVGSKRREGMEDIEVDSPSSTPSKGGWSMNIWGLMRGSKKPQEVDESSSPQFDALPISHHQRLDYVLKETNLGGSYLSALTSHTAYWSNYDVAYFVLTRLFPDLEAHQLQQTSVNISQQTSSPTESSTVGK